MWSWGTFTTNGPTPFLFEPPPTEVVGLGNIVALAAGDDHALALTNMGTLFTFGDGEYGKLGSGSLHSSKTPLELWDLPPLQKISATPLSSYALTVDGKLYRWGSLDPAKLDSENPSTFFSLPTPTDLDDPTLLPYLFPPPGIQTQSLTDFKIA